MSYKTWLAGTVLLPGCASGAQEASSVQGLEGPFVHQNLAIYVVRGEGTDSRAYLTLDEGLREGAVVLRETAEGNVGSLVVENRSDRWLFLHAADIVTGGKQDRTIASDVVVPPGSPPVAIDAFCVERGRWSGAAEAAFDENTAMASGAALKLRIQKDQDQIAVWAEVARQSEDVALMSGVASLASPSETGTYNAVVENATVRSRQSAYVEALRPRIEDVADGVGIIAAINGELIAADVYSSSELFRSLATKLLDSLAREAVLAPDEKKKAPAPDAAARFLAESEGPLDGEEELSETMLRKTRESASTVVFEYHDRDAGLLHRSVVKKN